MAFADDSVADVDAIAMLQRSVDVMLHPSEHGEETVTTMRRRGLPELVNPWCGLCGAVPSSWRYEVAPLREKNWVAALEALRACQADQRLAAEILKRIGSSFDGEEKLR
jgi:hypothetical protein